MYVKLVNSFKIMKTTGIKKKWEILVQTLSKKIQK